MWTSRLFFFKAVKHVSLSKAQLDEYIRRLEETERSLRTAEAKIVEKDQRIIEVERLLDCMGKVEETHHKN